MWAGCFFCQTQLLLRQFSTADWVGLCFFLILGAHSKNQIFYDRVQDGHNEQAASGFTFRPVSVKYHDDADVLSLSYHHVLSTH